MRCMHWCVLAALVVTVPGSGLTAQVSFTTKPSVVKADGKTTITFAVSAATDVEVAVLDGKGRIIRHLAAGMLGANAPAPLKPNSLKQELTWDGADDLGHNLESLIIQGLKNGFPVFVVKALAVREINVFEAAFEL